MTEVMRTDRLEKSSPTQLCRKVPMQVLRGAFLIVFCNLLPIYSAAQTTSFTYQGKLTDSGSPAGGMYDFTFKLFDAPGPPGPVGTQIGTDSVQDDVTVSAGIFTVLLNFGSTAFSSGGPRYLEIHVRPGSSSGGYTMLSPRQLLTSAPYAIKSLDSDTATTATNSTQLGGINANQYVVTTDPRMTNERPPAPGSGNYIQNSQITPGPQNSSFNISGNGTVAGTLSGGVVSAGTQYNLGGARFASNAGLLNTFVGGVGAPTVNTGGFNAFFGFNAGLANTSGASNSFLGMNSGSSNTVGIGNTFVGESAGASNTTGGFNSYFGTASSGSAGISNASAIGARATVTQSNSLVLGGINGLNNCTPANNCDSVNVGIGTTAPAARLHVVGNGLFTGPLTAGGVAILARSLAAPDASSAITVSTSYVQFNSGGSLLTINGATTPGQTLILEGPSSGSVIIPGFNGGNIALKTGQPFTMGVRDTLVLIWNGTFWLELSRSDNS